MLQTVGRIITICCATMLITVSLAGVVYNAVADEQINGDWIINEDITHTNKTITVKGDVIINYGGTLNLTNVTLIISSESEGEHGIYVGNGGTLNLQDCIVDYDMTTKFGYNIIIQNEGNAILNNTQFKHLSGTIESGGIVILSDYVVMTGCEVSFGKTYGIYISGSTPTIRNCTVLYNGDTGVVVNSVTSFFEIDNLRVVENNNRGIRIIDSPDVTLRNSSIIQMADNGKDISIDNSQLVSLNSYFNKSCVEVIGESSLLTVKWYLNIRVGGRRDIVDMASIEIKDVSQTTVFSGTTNYAGYRYDIEIIDYIHNYVAIIDNNPHSIHVMKVVGQTQYTADLYDFEIDRERFQMIKMVGPELKVSSISFSNQYPLVGTQFQITVTIDNIGDGDAEDFMLEIYDNDVLIYGEEINFLWPSSSLQVMCNHVISPNDPGLHIISAYVDSNDNYGELDESDNWASKEIFGLHHVFQTITISTDTVYSNNMILANDIFITNSATLTLENCILYMNSQNYPISQIHVSVGSSFVLEGTDIFSINENTYKIVNDKGTINFLQSSIQNLWGVPENPQGGVQILNGFATIIDSKIVGSGSSALYISGTPTTGNYNMQEGIPEEFPVIINSTGIGESITGIYSIGGHVNVINTRIEGNYDRGLFATDSVLIIEDCTFSNNPVGIQCQFSYSIISDTVISKSMVQGIHIYLPVFLEITGSKILDNHEGIFLNQGSILIDSCIISGNLNYGIMGNGITLEIHDTTIYDNINHGIFLSTSSFTLTGCLLAANGISFHADNTIALPRISTINNTRFENNPTAINALSSFFKLDSCIFSDNMDVLIVSTSEIEVYDSLFTERNSRHVFAASLSTVKMINSGYELTYTFTDDTSAIDIGNLMHFRVLDGTIPQPYQPITVSNGGQVVFTGTTDSDGYARGIEIIEFRITKDEGEEFIDRTATSGINMVYEGYMLYPDVSVYSSSHLGGNPPGFALLGIKSGWIGDRIFGTPKEYQYFYDFSYPVSLSEFGFNFDGSFVGQDYIIQYLGTDRNSQWQNAATVTEEQERAKLITFQDPVDISMIKIDIDDWGWDSTETSNHAWTISDPTGSLIFIENVDYSFEDPGYWKIRIPEADYLPPTATIFDYSVDPVVETGWSITIADPADLWTFDKLNPDGDHYQFQITPPHNGIDPFVFDRPDNFSPPRELVGQIQINEPPFQLLIDVYYIGSENWELDFSGGLLGERYFRIHWNAETDSSKGNFITHSDTPYRTWMEGSYDARSGKARVWIHSNNPYIEGDIELDPEGGIGPLPAIRSSYIEGIVESTRSAIAFTQSTVLNLIDVSYYYKYNNGEEQVITGKSLYEEVEIDLDGDSTTDIYAMTQFSSEINLLPSTGVDAGYVLWFSSNQNNNPIAGGDNTLDYLIVKLRARDNENNEFFFYMGVERSFLMIYP